MTEESTTYRVEQPTPTSTRTLFAISDDLEKLSELLDECDDTAAIRKALERGDQGDRSTSIRIE